MDSLEKIYKRFKENYRFNGSINIYPSFDRDLEKLLDFIKNNIRNQTNSNYDCDCTWRPPLGEDD